MKLRLNGWYRLGIVISVFLLLGAQIWWLSFTWISSSDFAVAALQACMNSPTRTARTADGQEYIFPESMTKEQVGVYINEYKNSSIKIIDIREKACHIEYKEHIDLFYPKLKESIDLFIISAGVIGMGWAIVLLSVLIVKWVLAGFRRQN